MRDRIEQLFAAWGRLAFRRAWLLIGLVLLIVGSLASQLPGITFDTSTEGFLHEDDPVRATYDAFREQFGQDTKILLVLRPPDVFDRGSLERLRALHEDIENEVPKLVKVTSLVNARETRGVGDELVVGELLEDWPETPEALGEVKQRALTNWLCVNNLISPDGLFTTIVIETEAYSSLGAGPEELAGFDELDFVDSRFSTGRLTMKVPFRDAAKYPALFDQLEGSVERILGADFEFQMTGLGSLVGRMLPAVMHTLARSYVIALASSRR